MVVVNFVVSVDCVVEMGGLVWYGYCSRKLSVLRGIDCPGER